MRVKKFLAALLAAALLASLALVPAGAAGSSFTDVGDGATALNADVLRLMGVVDGVGNNQFNPASNLTRAEFCTMVVKFMGEGDKVPLHATRTIFSDVTAKHWALGYVNLAATLTVADGENKVSLISGVGNGRFEPDAKITLGQAATILIRVLGYSSEQAGAVWPQSYMNLAKSIGLTDGVSAGAYDNITRAQAAQLFVNALSCKTGAGGTYYASLGTASEDVVLLAVNVDSDDGSEDGAIRTSAGTYLPKAVGVTPVGLQGRRGALVVNDKQEVVTFVPDDSTATTITLSGDAQPTYVKAGGGSQYTISSSTKVYTADKEEGDSYVSAYTSLRSGSQITMFSERGKVVAIYAGGGTSITEDAIVVMGSASTGTFHQLTGGATNFNIQKNRQSIRLSDIEPYDVVTYDSLNNTLVVSDLRLSCIFEDAAPTSKAPETITVLGHSFPVLESAWDSIGQCSLGGTVTLLLTADGKVAGMEPTSSKVRSTAIGMATSGGAEIFLPSGGTISLQGSVSNADNVADQLVTVSSGTKGKISASKLSSKSAPGDFSVSGMKLGGYTVAAGVRVYEQVSGGAMVPVDLSDLEMGSVSSGKIATYHLNSSDMVDFLVLNSVTGDAYQYGMLVKHSTSSDERIPLDSSITIRNSKGEEFTVNYEVETDSKGQYIFNEDGSPKYKMQTKESGSWSLYRGGSSNITFASQSGYAGKSGSFVGVVAGKNRDGDDMIRSVIELTQVKNVAPSDFFVSQGVQYVNAGGRTYRVADDVECYRNIGSNRFSEENWFTQKTGEDRLNACKAFSSDLTVYVDPVGEKVRVVAAG